MTNKIYETTTEVFEDLLNDYDETLFSVKEYFKKFKNDFCRKANSCLRPYLNLNVTPFTRRYSILRACRKLFKLEKGCFFIVQAEDIVFKTHFDTSYNVEYEHFPHSVFSKTMLEVRRDKRIRETGNPLQVKSFFEKETFSGIEVYKTMNHFICILQNSEEEILSQMIMGRDEFRFENVELYHVPSWYSFFDFILQVCELLCLLTSNKKA